MTSDQLIRCAAVEVRKGRFHLGPLDLSIGTGVTALVGRNGAGKTTLLRAIVGLETVAGGCIEVAGTPSSGRRPSRVAASLIGYVPQGALIPSSVRVRDLVMYSSWLKGVPPHQAGGLVERALIDLEVLEFASRKVGTLSGGERQRVSIAMSLVHQPEVLVLDEPSVGLDPIQRVSLRGIIDRLAEDRAVLISTHLVEDIGASHDSVVVLDEGQIGFQGTPDDLRSLATPADIGASDLERGLWRALGAGER